MRDYSRTPLLFGRGGACLSPAAAQRGFVLIVVLGIVVGLSLIAYTMNFSVRTHSRIAGNSVAEAQARALAAAAVEQSIAVLMQDETIVDGREEIWQDSSFFEEMELDTGTYEVSYPNPDSESGISYGLQDESAKVNLNVASREQLLELPGMDDSLADALIDWRDEDSMPGAFGAESEYYSSLPEPYSVRDAPLSSIRELLLIRGYTEAVLYGEDVNGNGQLDPNEDDGDLTPPLDDADGVLDAGIGHYVTVYSSDRNIQGNGQPRVNIQTASAEDLRNTLSGLTQEESDAVVNYRQKNKFGSIADLLNVTGSSGDGKSQSRGGDGSSRAADSRDSRPEDNSRQKDQKSGGADRPRGSRNVESQGSADGSRAYQTNAERGGGSNRSESDGGGGGRGGVEGESAPLESTQREGGDSNRSGSSQGGTKLFTATRFRQWADAITATDDETIPGLININTAPLEVLATIPGLTDDDVSQIDLLRNAGGTPFETLGDLFDVPGMTEGKFRSVAGLLTTRSFQFTANAKGALTSGRAQKRIEAVLERGENGVHVLYWREL